MKIFKLLFSRLALMLLIILAQIVLATAAAIYIEYIWVYTIIFYEFISIVIFIMIINRKGAADLKIPWVTAVLLLPILGVLIYVFFANHGLKPKYRRVERGVDKKAQEFFPKDSPEMEKLYSGRNQFTPTFQFLGNALNYSPSFGNRVTYYECGEKWFPLFIESLKKAKEFIFMEFFIIDRHSVYWKKIEEVLIAKAKEGVEVRLLYDDIGCAGLMRTTYPRFLEKKGIQCYRFNPFVPVLSGIFNNRDHRKIAVIDHKEAFTGGINLADEYANEIVRFGYWKDAMIKIEGPAIKNFTFLFLSLFDLAQLKLSDYGKYLNYEYERYEENALVTAFGDGPAPFYEHNSGESTFVNIIENAKETVYITTPYFIPTENLKSSIIRAGYRGVDIRILLPGIPDKKMVYKMAARDFKELVDAGIKVYTYNEGFNHEKAVVADGKIAFVGTINMDYRSLIHNFECGAIFMNSEAVKAVEDDLLDCYEHSELVDPNKIKLGFFTRLLCSIIAIFEEIL